MASKQKKNPLQPEDNTDNQPAKEAAAATNINAENDATAANENTPQPLAEKAVAKKRNGIKNKKNEIIDSNDNAAPAPKKARKKAAAKKAAITDLASDANAENAAATQPAESADIIDALPAPKEAKPKKARIKRIKAATPELPVQPELAAEQPVAEVVHEEVLPEKKSEETTIQDEVTVPEINVLEENATPVSEENNTIENVAPERAEAATSETDAATPPEESANDETTATPEADLVKEEIASTPAEKSSNEETIETREAESKSEEATLAPAEKSEATESNIEAEPTPEVLTSAPAETATYTALATQENPEEIHRLSSVSSSHKKQKVATINFFLKFYSKPGQNLFIIAQHPAFGNGDAEKALPMQYLNEETWTASLPIEDHFTATPVVYNYLVKEPDGGFVFDFGSDKLVDISNYATEEISIVDSWNVEGYFENAFYTEPFKDILLKNNHTSTEYAEPAVYTHTFKIKAPLLTQGQVVYITGNIQELNNWSAETALLLHKKPEDDFWFINLNLTDAKFSFDYKYGVYDIRTGAVVTIENGENRTFFDTISPDKKTIVNDGFIRLANNTWKGAGIAIPVFSLKSENSLGAGEFTDIKTLVDWAEKVGLKLIQLLPVNDTTVTKTWQDSYPYSAISAFALHAMYLNLNEVVNEENKHFLTQYDEEAKRLNALPALDYEGVNDIKWKVIHHIYPLQKEAVFEGDDYKEFFENNKHWLIPYAAFCCLRDKYNTAEYSRWQTNKTYDATAIEKYMQSPEVKDVAGMYYFVQYHLHLQLKEAAEYAHSKSIIVKGDIAIGVSLYSAETWQQPQLFNLDMQAGAPPDDFAVTGQNWSFPTYNWQKMQEDNFAWWKQRFEQMSYYFDAFRIDHILGFFRIWSIPEDAVQGILGHFVPAIPVYVNEFYNRGIYFDYNRYVKPFINDRVLNDLFGDQQNWVKDHLLIAGGSGVYDLRDEVSTQVRAQTYFAIREDNAHNKWLKNTIFDLISNVILFEEPDSDEQQFHFRYGMEETLSYKQLDPHTQWQIKELYVDYFYRRQNEFWYNEAMKKLPALKDSTNMLICGEDLGMVPESVPRVMSELGLLSLEVQRMPKDQHLKFVHLANAPYLSVVTPSTHDMSTIRGWWEEDKKATQLFFNQELNQQGDAPQFCEPWINQLIINQHLQSPAMWSIFQLQDLLGSDGNIRRQNPQEEQINKPAQPKFYWQYRMHVTLENLQKSEVFNSNLKAAVSKGGR